MIVIIDIDKKETHNYPDFKVNPKSAEKALEKYIDFIGETKGKISFGTLHKRGDLMVVQAKRQQR